MLGEDVFSRPNRRPPIERVWKEMNLTDLTLAYQDMLVRQRKRTQILRKETVSLASKIIEFRDKLKVGKVTEFRSLLSSLPTRPEIVAAFLATLELSRLRKMRVHQEAAYAEIWLELLESLNNLDANMVDGFESTVAPDALALENAGTNTTELNSAGETISRSQDDRHSSMDLTGEVTFNPVAQLEAQMNAKQQVEAANSAS